MLRCRFNLAGITRRLAANAESWCDAGLSQQESPLNSAEMFSEKYYSKKRGGAVGRQGTALPVTHTTRGTQAPYALHNYSLYVPLLHGSSLSRTLPPSFLLHLGFPIIFCALLPTLFPLIPGISPSNHERSRPPFLQTS